MSYLDDDSGDERKPGRRHVRMMQQTDPLIGKTEIAASLQGVDFPRTVNTVPISLTRNAEYLKEPETAAPPKVTSARAALKTQQKTAAAQAQVAANARLAAPKNPTTPTPAGSRPSTGLAKPPLGKRPGSAAVSSRPATAKPAPSPSAKASAKAPSAKALSVSGAAIDRPATAQPQSASQVKPGAGSVRAGSTLSGPRAPTRKPPGPVSHAMQALFGKFRSQLLRRNGNKGAIAFNQLSRTTRIFDKDGSCTLDFDEFKRMLAVLKIEVEESQLADMFKAMDRDGNGTIDLEEFARAVKGPMPPARAKIIRKAFATIDANGDQVLSLKEIMSKYKTDQHPAVLAGKMTQKAVIRDFIKNWDRNGDDQVTIDEFLDYYHGISTTIDSDEYFALMMNKAWGMPDDTISRASDAAKPAGRRGGAGQTDTVAALLAGAMFDDKVQFDGKPAKPK